MVPQHTVQSTTIDIFREQLTPTVLCPLLETNDFNVHSFTKNVVRKKKEKKNKQFVTNSLTQV